MIFWEEIKSDNVVEWSRASLDAKLALDQSTALLVFVGKYDNWSNHNWFSIAMARNWGCNYHNTGNLSTRLVTISSIHWEEESTQVLLQSKNYLQGHTMVCFDGCWFHPDFFDTMTTINAIRWTRASLTSKLTLVHATAFQLMIKTDKTQYVY